VSSIATKQGTIEVTFDLDRVILIEDRLGKSLFAVLEEMLGIKIGAGTTIDAATVLNRLTFRWARTFVAACLALPESEVSNYIEAKDVLATSMALLQELFGVLVGGTKGAEGADPQRGLTAPA
jgi:hypothetical protein